MTSTPARTRWRGCGRSIKAALEAQRDAIALELAVVASPSRLTDVAEVWEVPVVQGGVLLGCVPPGTIVTNEMVREMSAKKFAADPDLTIPAFMRRA